MYDMGHDSWHVQITSGNAVAERWVRSLRSECLTIYLCSATPISGPLPFPILIVHVRIECREQRQLASVHPVIRRHFSLRFWGTVER
jgi:hypothetical protein